MISLRDLLKERSYDHLIEWLKFPPNSEALEPGASVDDREAAFEMARSVLRQVNEVLKAAIDVGDGGTFVDVTRSWRLAVRDDRTWGTNRYPPDADAAALLLEQDRLMLGLVMWAAHLVATAEPGDRQNALGEILRTATEWFTESGQLSAAFEATQQRDEPWTTWFLSELPPDDAHFIPTREELRRALLLVTLRLNPGTPAAVPVPDDTLRYQLADLERGLHGVRDQAARWAWAIGDAPAVSPGAVQSADDVPPPTEAHSPNPADEIRARVDRLLVLLRQAKERADDRYRAGLRQAPLDPAKLMQFRERVLSAHRDARIVAAILHRAGAVQRHASRVPDSALHAREWLPKDWFVPDSNVVGTDMAAGSLGRVARRHEFKELLTALGDHVPWLPSADIRKAVLEHVVSLRAVGARHVLVVTPLNWRLGRALTGRNIEGIPETHALVPAAFRREFEGLLDLDTPILDHPEVPKDRFFVIDLATAVGLEEWPSDEDSGVLYDLRVFDPESAAKLLEEQPGVRGKDQTDEEALRTVQEQVLLDLTLCWRIKGVDARGVKAFAVPRDLSD